MAKQVINVGTTAGDGRGDPLRDAMIKINANFTELYEGIVVQTIVGENGTTLVDISANSVNANALTGTVPAGVATWDNLGGKPTSVAASGILDLYNIAQTDAQIASEIDDLKVELGSGGAGAIDASVLTGSLPAIDGSALTGITAGVASSLDGDMTGSVFADDSTLLVDGVSGTIPAANLTGALPAIDGSALTGVASAFSDLTGTPTTLSGYGITDAYTQTQVDTAITNATSSIVIPSGSSQSIDVVAADSTLLVDSSNGTLNSSALTKPIDLDDNEEVRFGTDNDMRIYHSGTTGNIDNNTGTLILDGATVRIQDGALANTAISAANGIATLLFENSAKLATSTDGVAVTGRITGLTDPTDAQDAATKAYVDANSGGGGGDFEGNLSGSVFADDSTLLVDGVNGTINSSALTKPIDLDDAEEVRFGTDNDMRILHSGTSGLIQNTTGTLVIAGPIVRIQDAGTAQSAFTAENGIATLYHLNSAKLETTTDGVAVTGKITGLTDPTAAQDAATKAYVDANAGGASSRSTATGNTNSLADAAEADLDITGFKSYALLAITTDRAARVRLYVSDATRTADASRAEGVDPTSDAGLIAEVITTGADTVIISPGAYGFNLESTPTTTIPCRVTNKSGVTATVQVTLNILQLEA